MGKGGQKIQVTLYYMSQHFGVCTIVDALKRIIVNEKEAWTGNLTAETTLSIDKPDLFGGPTKQGGVGGTMYFLPGHGDQVLPDLPAQKLGRANGADCPAYRGLTSLFFIGTAAQKGFYWTANDPYLPGVWATVLRAPKGLTTDYALIPRPGSFTTSTTWDHVCDQLNPSAASAPWAVGGISFSGAPGVCYSFSGTFGSNTFYGAPDTSTFPSTHNVYAIGKIDGFGRFWSYGGVYSRSITSNVEYDANPAHVIYECLTNFDWGMGSSPSLIDVDAFEAAGVDLYLEPLGLSLMWTRQATIQDFIQEVLDHIQAVLFVDPQTGLLTLKLIRGDYDVATLPTISPSTANLSNFGRKLWGDIVNEINVTWTNPESEKDETVTAHDLASITTQGGIVSDSRNYYGVRYADLAARLAARDLRSAGAPLATCDAEVDRSLWYLRPASVLLLDWPEYGLDGVVMRVTSIDYGKPGDPVIKLSLIEDVFGLDAADYVTPPSTSWTDPSALPTQMDEQKALTLPYFFTASSITTLTGATYPEVLAGVLGASSNDDTFGYELWGEVTLADSTTEWQKLGSLNLAGYATLSANLAAEATSSGVAFSGFVGSVAPTQAGIAIIGSGSESANEIALITSAASTFTLSRGVLDTVPHAWPSGTPVWFVTTDLLWEDPSARASGEVVSYKLLTRTSKGLLDLSSAPLLTATLTDRPWQPSRPANVTISGVQFNDASTPVNMVAASTVPVTWANRNRLAEDTQVLGWTASTVAPETGQTTTLNVYDATGTSLLAAHSGLTGTSFSIPSSSFGSSAIAIVEASSSRTDADGTFTSLQAQRIFVQLVAIAAGADTAAGTATASFSGGAVGGSNALSATGAGTAALTSTAIRTGSFASSGATSVGLDATNASWTPSSLSSKVAWWRADTGITLSGSAVQSWAPKEGTGTFAFSGTAPGLTSSAINSLPAVDNTGGGGTLALSYTNTSAIVSVAWVGTVHNSGSAYGRQVSLGNTTAATDYSNNSSFNVARDNTTANINMERNSITTSDAAITYDSAFIAVAVWDGTNGSLYVNGTLVGSALANTANFNINEMMLWQSAKTNPPSDFGRGVNADMVLSNAAFTTTERQKLEGYFAWRYGLTGDLPVGHPYKSVAP